MTTATSITKKRLSCGAKKGILKKAPKEKVTARYLLSMEACESQVEAFKKLFPYGMHLTRTNLVYLAKNRVPLIWTEYALLTPEARKITKPAFDKIAKTASEIINKHVNRYNRTEISWKRYQSLVKRAEESSRIKQANVLANVLGLE